MQPYSGSFCGLFFFCFKDYFCGIKRRHNSRWALRPVFMINRSFSVFQIQLQILSKPILHCDALISRIRNTEVGKVLFPYITFFRKFSIRILQFPAFETIINLLRALIYSFSSFFNALWLHSKFFAACSAVLPKPRLHLLYYPATVFGF